MSGTGPTGWRGWIRWPLYGAAALVCIGLLATLAMRWMISRAPDYQQEIKAWVHEQTGFHIRFASVDAQLRVFGPELYFDRIELRSRDDAHVLVSARGASVALDLWGVIRTGKLLSGLVSVDSPQIDIERRGSRSFLLASQIELFPQTDDPASLNLGNLPAGRLRIRNARLSLHGWNADLPHLVLPAANINIAHLGNSLELDLRTRMPDPLEGSVRITVQADGSAALKSAAWEAHVYARNFSLAGWHRLLPDYSNTVEGGLASFDLLAGGQGAEIALGDLDFGAYELKIPGDNGGATAFAELSGRLVLHHSGNLWSLNVQRLRALQSGRHDPPMQLGANWRYDAGELRELTARANSLDVDRLLPARALLPDKALRERIKSLGLSGRWTDPFVQFRTAPAGGVQSWYINAAFDDMGFAPNGNNPGFAGLSGSVSGNERGGRFQIHSRAAQMIWPGEWPQPVGLDRLEANIFWKRNSSGMLVASSDLEIKNADVSARSKFSYQSFDAPDPAQIVLASEILGANANATHKYLPRQHLAPKALEWLSRAFVDGHVPSGSLVLRGPLRNFPFRDGSGLFLVRFPVEELALDYQPGWPRLEHLSADAEFRNAGLRVRIRHGKVGDLEVDGGEGVFEDFKTGELHVNAHSHGDAQAALEFLRASPLDAMAEHAFSNVQGKGPIKSDIDLFLPFKAFDERRVLVDVHLDGISVSHPASRLSASEVSGDFTVDGPQVPRAEVRGRSFGGSFQLRARETRGRADKGTQLEARGNASVDSVIEAFDLPQSLIGGTHFDWRALLRMTAEPVRDRSIRLTSTLQGLEIKLPAPFTKPAESSALAYLDIDWPKNAGIQLRFGMPPTVRAIATLSADPGARRITRASVVFGGATPAYAGDSGIYLSGNIGALDLAAWLRLRAKPGTGHVAPLDIREAKVEIGELDFHSLAFRDIGLAVTPTQNAWNIDVLGQKTAGHIAIPSAAGTPWEIQMERANIVDVEDASPKSDAGALPADPRAIPAMNFKVQEFSWGDRSFGAIDARLERLADGVALTHLEVQSPNFRLEATGNWRGPAPGQSQLAGTLVSTSVGQTLQQFGFAEVIRAKSGRVEFDLNGLGPPSLGILASLSGRVKIDLEDGELVGIRPGAGRVLGLASVASLRRRLALDFSDLTDKGLAFDTVHGSFNLRSGDAYTDDTLLKGPAAEIGMIGRIGLAKRDYDQTAVVTGSIGNTLPLAGALAGGPVVGAAVLLFSQVFKQPLKGLARGYYRITGDWDNPTVERVKSGEAAAAQRETHESEGSK